MQEASDGANWRLTDSVRGGPKSSRWTLTGRHRAKFPSDKQSRSDGNMRGLRVSRTYRVGRGAMARNISQAAATPIAAMDVVRYNRERVEANLVHHQQPAQLIVRARNRHDQAAGQA